jgi:hypothetical protein
MPFHGRCTAALPRRVRPVWLESTSIGFGGAGLLVGRNSPLLVHGALPADMVWAVLPLNLDRPVLTNGRSAGPHMLALYGAGALHEGANHAEASWTLLALKASAAERLIELPGRSPILRPGAHAMLDCGPQAWRQAVLLLRSAAEVAVQDPEVFEVEEARRSLRSSVLEMAQDLLTGAWGGNRPRILRAWPERQRLVRTIEEYLKAYPAQASTVDDLAATLGALAARHPRQLRDQPAALPPPASAHALPHRPSLRRPAWAIAAGDRAVARIPGSRPLGAGLSRRVLGGSRQAFR